VNNISQKLYYTSCNCKLIKTLCQNAANIKLLFKMAAAIEKFVELVTLHCQSVQCVNFGHLILYIFLCLYYHIIIKRAQNTLRTAFCELKSPCLFTDAGSGLSVAAARTDTPRVCGWSSASLFSRAVRFQKCA